MAKWKRGNDAIDSHFRMFQTGPYFMSFSQCKNAVLVNQEETICLVFTVLAYFVFPYSVAVSGWVGTVWDRCIIWFLVLFIFITCYNLNIKRGKRHQKKKTCIKESTTSASNAQIRNPHIFIIIYAILGRVVGEMERIPAVSGRGRVLVLHSSSQSYIQT